VEAVEERPLLPLKLVERLVELLNLRLESAERPQRQRDVNRIGLIAWESAPHCKRDRRLETEREPSTGRR